MNDIPIETNNPMELMTAMLANQDEIIGKDLLIVETDESGEHIVKATKVGPITNITIDPCPNAKQLKPGEFITFSVSFSESSIINKYAKKLLGSILIHEE